MLEKIKEHRKVLARTIGIILLLGGIASLFWSKPDTLSKENEAAEANIKRMEAALPKKLVANTQKGNSSSPFMKAYMDKQKEHLRYAVILVIISGFVFLGYSFIKKESDKES